MKTNYFTRYETKKRIYIIERYYGSSYKKINWKYKTESEE
jgi:hypothetical protein